MKKSSSGVRKFDNEKRFVRLMMEAFVEMERSIRSERIRAGIRARKKV